MKKLTKDLQAGDVLVGYGKVIRIIKDVYDSSRYSISVATGTGTLFLNNSADFSVEVVS